MSTRLVRNVLSNWTGLFLTMAISFFMSPFLVHSLGDQNYGLWVLILSVTGYMGLLDIGLRVSVVKYVSRLHAVSDFVGLSRTISTALAIYGATGVVIMVITLVLEAVFDRVFSIPPASVPTGRLVLLLAGANVAVTLLLSVFNGLLAGLQRYDRMQAAGISLLLARTAAIVLLINLGFGIVALGAVHLVTQIVNGLIAWRYAVKECPALEIRRSRIELASARTLYSYSGYVMVNNVGRFLLFGSGELIIGMFLGTAAITSYAIAGTVAQYLQQLIITMVMVLHPYSSAADARGEKDNLVNAAVIGTKLSLLIGLPATITFVTVGHTFISLWMGPSYAAVAAPILVVLMLARLVHLSQAGSYEVLLGMARHRVPTLLNLAAGMASVAAGLFLIERFGLYGLAVGSAIPILITHGIIQPLYTNRVLNIGLRIYLQDLVFRPLLAAIPYTVALVVATRLFPPASLVGLGLLIAAHLPIFGLSAFFICFSASERRRLLEAVLGGTFAAALIRPAPSTRAS